VRRRDLLLLLCSVTTIPHALRAEQKAMRVIGFLSGVSPETYTPFVAAFRSGLNDAGYVEGSNLAVEYRWAKDHRDRLPALAEDLVRHNVEVIVAGGGAPGIAKAATTTIPIVFVIGTDPVAAGIVASFNRPGGNLTGVSFLTGELMPKRLEILHELVPGVGTIAMLVNPGIGGSAQLTAMVKDAAAQLGLQLPILEVRAAADFEAAFARLAEVHAGALLVSTDPLFTERRAELVSLAARYGVPASYAWREFVAAGGLVSYGASIAGAYRQAGVYVGRILNGDKPADLPVIQPATFELVINLSTAKALGLTVPPAILARADEVIE
jgi:putative tryptophan/tyrosine transport system substrate-binding protein